MGRLGSVTDDVEVLVELHPDPAMRLHNAHLIDRIAAVLSTIDSASQSWNR